MVTVSQSRRLGINASLAIKVPVIAATTANITLSGEQTIDGIALVDGDRCLVQNQTDAIENGIYEVDTGTWSRAPDWNGSYDVQEGTIIPISRGTTNGVRARRVTNTGTIVIDTTSITFGDALYSSSDGVSFTQAGTGAVERTSQSKMRERVSVFDFMTEAEIADVQAGTALVDVTAAIGTAAATLSDGDTLEFGRGTYLTSYANAPTANADDFGRKIIYLSGKKNITIRGNGAIIKCVNHDCSTGGLMFGWVTGSQNITFEGFSFDMTFTGVNTSASLYPFVGGIICSDAQTGSQAQSALCSNFTARDLKFKLYHPYGQYATSGAAYSGDGNNGYKVLSVFCSGDATATDYDNQNRNVTAENILFEDGHNAYGVWVWAYNHVTINNVNANSWVGKYSNSSGIIQGAGVPMIRYHQFYCEGIAVAECDFRAKPCDERTVSGFEGAGKFSTLTNNLTGDLSNGRSSVDNNKIVLGNGDSANSLEDVGVDALLYGDIIINGNVFDGITQTTNAYGGVCVRHNPQSGGGEGKSSLLVDGNTFGVHNSYNDNIRILNGDASSEAERRCRALIVTNNISLSQSSYFLDIDGGSPLTYHGCRHVVIESNIVIGTHNTVWNSASTNSRAFRLAASEATDVLIVRRNIVTDKYYFAIATNVLGTAKAIVGDNELSGVTTEYLGGSLALQGGYGSASIASAATITLPHYGSAYTISGTTNVTSVTAALPGREVTLNFAGILTFTDGGNLKLAGNFVTTADDTITLVCDGTNWLEKSRSIN